MEFNIRGVLEQRNGAGTVTLMLYGADFLNLDNQILYKFVNTKGEPIQKWPGRLENDYYLNLNEQGYSLSDNGDALIFELDGAVADALAADLSICTLKLFIPSENQHHDASINRNNTIYASSASGSSDKTLNFVNKDDATKDPVDNTNTTSSQFTATENSTIQTSATTSTVATKDKKNKIIPIAIGGVILLLILVAALFALRGCGGSEISTPTSDNTATTDNTATDNNTNEQDNASQEIVDNSNEVADNANAPSDEPEVVDNTISQANNTNANAVTPNNVDLSTYTPCSFSNELDDTFIISTCVKSNPTNEAWLKLATIAADSSRADLAKRIFISKGRTDAAIALEYAKALDPNNQEVVFDTIEKDANEAKYWYETVLKLDSENKEAKAALGAN